MSLNLQLIALLRVAEEPQTVDQLRGQLMAMGVTDHHKARRRLWGMQQEGIIEKAGEGADATYRLVPGPKLDEYQRRAGSRTGQLPAADPPATTAIVQTAASLRDRIVELLASRPGMSAAQIKTAMLDAGLGIARNEPHATLYKLVQQGRIRHDGKKPDRRYYAVDGATAPTPGPKAQAAARQAAAAAASASAADPTLHRPASAVVAPSSTSDNPLDLLDDAIAQHLELCEPWITRDRIAHDIDENPLDVAKSLKRLVDAKRASVRTIDGTREYAFGTVTWAPEATPTSTAAAAEKPSEPDAGETIPIRPAAVDAQADGLPAAAATPCEPPQSATEATAAASIPRTEGSAVTAGKDRHSSDPANPREEVIYMPRPLFMHSTLSVEVSSLQNDLEDHIGRACDERVDHAAIKALVTASAALRRASRHLQPISTTPAAITGVPPS